MRTRLEYVKHFFWLIGWGVNCLIKLDKDAFIETMMWLNIHLTCRGFEYDKEKADAHPMSTKEKYGYYLTIAVGIAMFLLIVELCCGFIVSLFRL